MKPIISRQVRVRHPELFKVSDFSIIDDFCYFSTQVQIGLCSHIAAGCTVGGGKDYRFELGDFSSLSSGVRIWCTSDNFAQDIVTILPVGAPQIKEAALVGDVLLKNYTAIGANSVVLPNNVIPEGTVVGALSFVPPGFKFKPWTVYVGSPIREVGPRNQEAVMMQVDELRRYIAKNAA